ncbi:MAG: TonB family protein [Pyrinomonadaceae bacterium]
MSKAAFSSAKPENPFNLTATASKAIGSAIGCDYFILVNSATLRRSSSQRPEYYEAHAAIYGASARSGRLVFWRLVRFEAAKPQAAQNLLAETSGDLALQIAEKLKAVMKAEFSEPPLSEMEELPDDGLPSAKNFKAPIPYRRIKPEYTSEAFLYDIRATVDIVVDLDKTGVILNARIVRWAGYGLDESVEKAVRSMNWRPAERNGKPLPMRFLLRYNFKKIEPQ